MFSLSDAALALKSAHKAQSKQIPGPGKIVLALCPFIEKTSQPHPSGKGMVTYQILRCPRRDACTLVTPGYSERGRIKVQDKAGYTNPYKHILKCVFGNDNKHMLDAYWESQVGKMKLALLEKYTGSLSAGTMPSSVPPSFNLLSKRDYA
jgi:hypothetical protein